MSRTWVRRDRASRRVKIRKKYLSLISINKESQSKMEKAPKNFSTIKNNEKSTQVFGIYIPVHKYFFSVYFFMNSFKQFSCA